MYTHETTSINTAIHVLVQDTEAHQEERKRDMRKLEGAKMGQTEFNSQMRENVRALQCRTPAQMTGFKTVSKRTSKEA